MQYLAHNSLLVAFMFQIVATMMGKHGSAMLRRNSVISTTTILTTGSRTATVVPLGYCSFDPSSSRGSKVLLFRMLLLVAIPIVCTLGYSFSHLVNNVIAEGLLATLGTRIQNSHIFSNIIHNIQIERLDSVYYLASNNSEFLPNLTFQHVYTDSLISSLETQSSMWKNVTELKELQSNIEEHRRRVLTNSTSIVNAIDFYIEVIEKVLPFLTVTFDNTDDPYLWKLLVANKMTILVCITVFLTKYGSL